MANDTQQFGWVECFFSFWYIFIFEVKHHIDSKSEVKTINESIAIFKLFITINIWELHYESSSSSKDEVPCSQHILDARNTNILKHVSNHLSHFKLFFELNHLSLHFHQLCFSDSHHIRREFFMHVELLTDDIFVKVTSLKQIMKALSIWMILFQDLIEHIPLRVNTFFMLEKVTKTNQISNALFVSILIFKSFHSICNCVCNFCNNFFQFILLEFLRKLLIFFYDVGLNFSVDC